MTEDGLKLPEGAIPSERHDFTPRAFDRAAGTLTVDFVLHGSGSAIRATSFHIRTREDVRRTRLLRDRLPRLRQRGSPQGDLIVWGLDPRHDADNLTDTGSVTSGSSSQPHLHIHAQTFPTLRSPGIGLPMTFANVLIDGDLAESAHLIQGSFVSPADRSLAHSIVTPPGTHIAM